MNLLNLSGHHLIYLARDGPLFSNKNNNYSCQAKRLFGVHSTLKSAGETGGSQNINKIEFSGVWMFHVIFYSCVLLRKCYYNPYNAPALINALTRFFENNVTLNFMNCFTG